jgi:hypothetical protein
MSEKYIGIDISYMINKSNCILRLNDYLSKFCLTREEVLAKENAQIVSGNEFYFFMLESEEPLLFEAMLIERHIAKVYNRELEMVKEFNIFIKFWLEKNEIKTIENFTSFFINHFCFNFINYIFKGSELNQEVE